jgi:hypothetical protein
MAVQLRIQAAPSKLGLITGLCLPEYITMITPELCLPELCLPKLCLPEQCLNCMFA